MRVLGVVLWVEWEVFLKVRWCVGLFCWNFSSLVFIRVVCWWWEWDFGVLGFFLVWWFFVGFREYFLFFYVWEINGVVRVFLERCSFLLWFLFYRFMWVGVEVVFSCYFFGDLWFEVFFMWVKSLYWISG